ncbi:MAG: TIGR01212 family radical SAM protein [Bacteroidales bacterium]|nr:TIGR01212 family radical SAM protein [Bacteroidales bacterium]
MINSFYSKPFRTLSDYFIENYHSRLQKISVFLPFTCPNKDGTKGKGGCYYCNNEGFVPSYCRKNLSINHQLKEGIAFHRKRYRRSNGFLAYFQANTNTYTHVDELLKFFTEALEVDGIVGLSISTRPDCISEDLLQLLLEFKKKCFIMIEIGVESLRNEALMFANRGHDVATSLKTIKKLHYYKIFTVIHYILGLPPENPQTLLADIQLLNQLPFNAIKLHHLQILKNTYFETLYKKNPFRFYLFELTEYISFISHYLSFLRPDIYIDRLASEVPPRYLIAPQWGNIRYDMVARKIEDYMKQNNLFQGKFYNRFLTTSCMF